MSKTARKKLINAELHAHAQQLLEFARRHDVGFVVMLVDRDKSRARWQGLTTPRA